MSELDIVLRESLGRLAEPGDPTGVADAVRARVGAAGAGGETPPGAGPTGGGGSGAAGAGGSATGAGFWGGWAPLGILIGLSVAGGVALGLAQASDAPESSAYAPLSLPSENGVPAASCPGGATVALLDPGARVVAVARTEDGTAVAVRNPSHLDSLVWIPLSAAEPDAGSDVDALPVSGCEESGPIVPIVTEAPEPVPTETTEAPDGGGNNGGGNNGGGGNPPPPPPDTTAPVISGGAFSPGAVDGDPDYCAPPTSTTISLNVTDNVGVSNVSAFDNNSKISVGLQSHSGTIWTFVATASGQPAASSVQVTVTFVASDAAGNSSQTARQFTFEYCLT